MITTYEPLTLPNAPGRVHTTRYAVAEASVVQSDEPVACNSLSYSERKQKSVDDWAAARSELDEALIQKVVSNKHALNATRLLSI